MISSKGFVLLGVATFFITNCISYDADYRLSTNHIPKNYELELFIDPYYRNYSGNVTIHFSTKSSTKDIRLHACPNFLALKEITVNDKNICNVTRPSTSLEYVTEIVTITCEDSIKTSDKNKILISFDGVYSANVHEHPYTDMGLKRFTYKNGPKSSPYVATQFEPIFARRGFPCFDEPQLKAEFNVTIVHPGRYKAIFNTPAYSEKVENGLTYSKFEKTPLISTYLLGFVVSKFTLPKEVYLKSEGTPNNIPIYVLTNQLNNIGTIKTYGQILVDTLQKWLDISYEELGIKKLDFLLLPIQYTGSISSWGLISFHEFDVLDNENNTSPEMKQFIISNIVHELALQWFGDYVTPDWWSNVWLKEAFAGYFRYFIPDQVQNLNLDRQRQFITENVQPALYSDSPYPFGQPLSNKEKEIFWQDDIVAKARSVNFQKGPCIIRMIESLIGEKHLKKGVQLYLKENKYKNTNPAILLETLERVYNSPYSLTKIMNNWIYKPGYPVVSVLLSKDGKSVKIQQDEYNTSTKNKTTWYIPISYTTSSEKKFDVKVRNILYNEPLNINLKEKSWIIVNLQQTGFYRVIYDKELWKRITVALKTTEMKEIHVSNRAQLIDDVFTLARDGIISYNISLNLLEYIRKETEYEPWYTAETWIKEMIFLLRPLKGQQYFQKFKKTVLGWIKEAFPHEINATTNLQKLTKNVIFDLKNVLGDQQSLEQSENTFESFTTGKWNDGNTNIKTILCRGLQINDNSKNHHEILLENYKKSISTFERKQILSAIECIDDPSNLEQYLLETIAKNSKFSEKDIRTVYESVSKNSNFGIEVYFKFLKKHLNEIIKKYSFLNLSDLLLKAVHRIANQKQLSELKEITEKYQEIEGMKFIEETLLERKNKQLDMRAEQIRDIISFFA